MKVFMEPGFQSRGISRVAFQLSQYMPVDLTLAGDPANADLVVMHIIGRHDHNLRKSQEIKKRGGAYAVIQYVLDSCRNPDPNDWLELWGGAKVVWSYFDLKKYVKNFYHAPLGAYPQVFHKEDTGKLYEIGFMGYDPNIECISEVYEAVYKSGVKAVQIGGAQLFPSKVVSYFKSPDDSELRIIYNQCKYFSCLRRKGGFEMTALEALLCGARPIMLDTPNFRQWFNDYAEFIPDQKSSEVIGKLAKLLKKGPRKVSSSEIEKVQKNFDWKVIVKGFWERCTI